MTANEVGQGTTGKATGARVDVCGAAAAAVEVEVDIEVDVEVDVEVDSTDDVVEPGVELGVELGVDFVTDWDVVADVDPGVDVSPQPAITTTPVNPSPTSQTVRCRHTRPPTSRSPTKA